MILIAGDSWAFGEFVPKYWEKPHYQCMAHGGLAEWLSNDGHQVLNLAIPGSTNGDSCSSIINFLIANPRHKVKKIFVFQTDWTRDVYYYSELGSENRPIGNMALKSIVHTMFHNMPVDITANTYRDFGLSKFYAKLSEITSTYNINIYLVGGLSDLIAFDKFEQEYPGVKPVCHSMVSLALYNDHIVTDSNNITTGYLGWDNTKLIDYIKQKLSTDEINQLLHQVDLATQRHKVFLTQKDLFPDRRHPSRYVHKQLYELILSKNIL